MNLASHALQIESPVEGLYASAPETLPFDRSLSIRAFLLRRPQGNVLVYSTSQLAADAAAIRDLGGIERQYLNHRHEAMFPSHAIGAPLFVHEDERSAVAEVLHVRAGFTRRHLLDGDFEVIPTPGHTSGATAFLWDSGSHRFLFTGDSVYLRDGEWVGAVLDSSDRRAYLESLALMRELEFDVLVPWATTGGRPYHALTDRADARRRIDAIIERVRRGKNH
jgi:glyoxylase-like metal-dependent hydrolase (beta-lactamase superfamily II)